MKNKAQISSDVFSWVPKLLLLVAVILVLLFLVRMYVVTNIDTKDAEAAVLINRILYSPNGIAYYDEELERAYPGIIDLDKFNDSVLERAITLPENRIIAAKLILSDLNKENPKEIFFNKKWYDNLAPRQHLSGPGGATITTKESYVLVKLEDCIDSKEITDAKIDGCDKISMIEGDGISLKEEAKTKGEFIEWSLLKNAIENKKILFVLTPDLDMYLLNLGKDGIDIQIPANQKFKAVKNKAPSITISESAHYYIPKCSYIATKLKKASAPTEKADVCYIVPFTSIIFEPRMLKFEVIVPNT